LACFGLMDEAKTLTAHNRKKRSNSVWIHGILDRKNIVKIVNWRV
jgi:hypothetical protein